MKALLNAAIVLALIVVSLGAYVRLSDAGLGCPDWPGCYGHWVGVPDAAHEQAAAVAQFPGRPVEAAKAWKEVIHRYAAGTLGLLIAAIAVAAWRRRAQQPPGLALALVGLVVVQALLGMWTVTLLLKPVVVTAHLVGGMTTLALLFWLRGQQAGPAPATPRSGRTAGDAGKVADAKAGIVAGILALAAVALQIALGGWVSSHYAALACPEFPTCRDGQWLPVDTLTAIQMAHRTGALLVTVMVGRFVFVLARRRQSGPAALVALALCGQLGIGIANVLTQRPLHLAVAHNTGAALLLLSVLYALSRLRQPGDMPSRRMSPTLRSV